MPPRPNGFGITRGDIDAANQNLHTARQNHANTQSAQNLHPQTDAGNAAYLNWRERNPSRPMTTGADIDSRTEEAVMEGNLRPGYNPDPYGYGKAKRRQAELREQEESRAWAGGRDAEYAAHHAAMADIKANGVDTTRVRLIEQPLRPGQGIDDVRRATEKKNGWEVGSMNPGGANYAANGPKAAAQVAAQVAAQAAAQAAAPQVAAAGNTGNARAGGAPRPLSPEAQSLLGDLQAGYNATMEQHDAGIRARGGDPAQVTAGVRARNNAERAGAGGNVGKPVGGLTPSQGDALRGFQDSNNAALASRNPGRAPDDVGKLTPGEQTALYNFNLERGNIPRPQKPHQAPAPNPLNPNKDLNDRPRNPSMPGNFANSGARENPDDFELGPDRIGGNDVMALRQKPQPSPVKSKDYFGVGKAGKIPAPASLDLGATPGPNMPKPPGLPSGSFASRLSAMPALATPPPMSHMLQPQGHNAPPTHPENPRHPYKMGDPRNLSAGLEQNVYNRPPSDTVGQAWKEHMAGARVSQPTPKAVAPPKAAPQMETPKPAPVQATPITPKRPGLLGRLRGRR